MSPASLGVVVAVGMGAAQTDSSSSASSSPSSPLADLFPAVADLLRPSSSEQQLMAELATERTSQPSLQHFWSGGGGGSEPARTTAADDEGSEFSPDSR